MTETPGHYTVDVLAFRGRLDRLGFVVTPLVNILFVATALGLLLAARAFVLPDWIGARLVAIGVVVALAETVASFLSVQVRRLRDAGFGWWHVVWISVLPPALAQVFPPAGLILGTALNMAFLFWPGRKAPGPVGSADDPHFADVPGQQGPLLGG